MHDSMYVKYPKEVNPRDKKKVDGCQGLGEGEKGKGERKGRKVCRRVRKKKTTYDLTTAEEGINA